MRHLIRFSLAGLFMLILVAGAAVRPAAATPCRDAQGNEICTFYAAQDGRINSGDSQATMAAYCEQDNSLTIYGIFGSQGIYQFNVTAQQLSNALATARSSGQNLLIQEGTGGRQLYAVYPNQFQLHDYQSPKGYDFLFDANRCGNLPSPTGAFSAGATGSSAPAVTTGNTAPASTGNNSPVTFTGTATNTSDLNLRTGPAKTFNRVLIIPANTTLKVIGRNADLTWIQVQFNDLRGWVAVYYTNLRDTDISSLPVIATSAPQ